MALVFNVALHILLAGSMLVFVYSLVRAAWDEPNGRERSVRLMALAAGALVTLGASASGASYAKFTVDALAGGRPASFLASVGATIFPALLGFGLGFFLTRQTTRDEYMAMRILCFVGMLTAVAFLQVYAEATKVNGVFLGKASLPNVSFVAGIILTMLFTLPTGLEKSGSAQGLGSRLSALLGRGKTEAPRQNPSSGDPGRRYDPFQD